MKSLSERMSQANDLLAPYAVRHGGGLRRETDEPEDERRFPFQRDRDRIVHTKAFRRLKGKTQVFVDGGGGDHYRTRMTHTLEVALLSRDMAGVLGLNPDLAECIALAHDLGHPPFGHAGESELDTWMRNHGGHFEHNEQSIRIVRILAEHSSAFRGLNLSREVLEGLMKHRTPHDTPASDTSERNPSLEAQLVNIADEIAYTAHDCDDGISSGLLTLDGLRANALATRADEKRAARGTSLRGSIITLLTEDLYKTSGQLLQSVDSLEDVYATADPLIRFCDDMRSDLDQLRGYLSAHMYYHPEVLALSNKGRQIITQLCTHYIDHPDDKIGSLVRNNSSALPQAICDYVSGMTDRYAKDMASSLGFAL